MVSRLCFSQSSLVPVHWMLSSPSRTPRFWRSDSGGILRRPDVFALIARQMRAIFADARHLVATDLAMGLVLVRALQKRQRQLGKRFTAAHSNPSSSSSSLPAVSSSPALSTSSISLEEANQDSATASASSPTSAFSASDPARIAASGAQPPLSIEAADDLAAARYYSKYAIGAYGWPLYVFMQPCSWCCGLAPACCLSGTSPPGH
jgi:hypothetical protein